MYKKKNGFTLIELLIVVAIIAILAAIAVPNFLDAQVRSKVSKSYAEMRTIANAITAYEVDHNAFPQIVWTGNANQRQRTFFLASEPANAAYPPIGYLLSTPISYMTSIPFDVFNTKIAQDRWQQDNAFHKTHSVSVLYGYIHGGQGPWVLWGIPPYRGREFNWSLQSYGPDLERWHAKWYAVYDPTNGTISYGDIFYLDTVGFTGGKR